MYRYTWLMPSTSPNPQNSTPVCPSPGDFWERVTVALKTSAPEVLRAAADAFRGVYESEHAYIVGQVAEHLQPPNLAWLLACCDPARLREGYEGRALVVWSIALEDGGCMVFESVREALDVIRAVLEIEPDDER